MFCCFICVADNVLNQISLYCDPVMYIQRFLYGLHYLFIFFGGGMNFVLSLPDLFACNSARRLGEILTKIVMFRIVSLYIM